MTGRFVVRKVPEALTREQKRFGGVPCSDLHLMKTLQSWECTDGFVLVLAGWVPPLAAGWHDCSGDAIGRRWLGEGVYDRETE